jgi:2,3-bisphosphoglycerate-dependent phosphoglycerate mutase
VSNDDALLPPPGLRQRGPAPTGCRIVLIRHGECYANALGVAGGPRGDGGLTDLGRRQVAALAERLARTNELSDVAALYTSTLPRAQQTGSLIADVVGRTAVAREGFEEVNIGEGDGLPWPEFVARYGNPGWDVNPDQRCAPGGESLREFFERTHRQLATIVNEHPRDRVVVVTHGGFIEQAMKIYQGLDAGVRLQPRIEHCSMTELEWREGHWRLLRYNDVAPLASSVLEELRDEKRQI